MNPANILILIAAGTLLVVVIGLVSIAVRASRRGQPRNQGAANNTAPAPNASRSWLVTSLLIGGLLAAGFVALNHSTILSWFAEAETVTNWGMWLNPIFWIGLVTALFFTTKLFSLDVSRAAQTSKSLLGSTFIKVLLAAIAVILFYLFLGPIKEALEGMTANEAGPTATWMIGNIGYVAPAAIVGTWIIYRFMRDSEKVPLVDQFILLLVVPALVAACLFVVAVVVDIPTNGAVGRQAEVLLGVREPKVSTGGSCMSVSQLNTKNSIIPTNGKCLSVRRTDGGFMVFSGYRQAVVVRIATQTKEAYPDLFETRNAYTFLQEGRRAGPQGFGFVVQEQAFYDAGIEAIDVFFSSVAN